MFCSTLILTGSFSLPISAPPSPSRSLQQKAQQAEVGWPIQLLNGLSNVSVSFSPAVALLCCANTVPEMALVPAGLLSGPHKNSLKSNLWNRH